MFSMVYKSDNLKPVNSFVGGAPGEGCLYIVYNTVTWCCLCKRVYRILTSRKIIRLIQDCFSHSLGALFEGNQSGNHV